MQSLRSWFDVLDGVPLKPPHYCARCQGVCTGACKGQASREYDKSRANDPFRALRNTARWRALRLKIKLRDVLCKVCGYRSVQDIDHIIAAAVWAARGGSYWDEGNLQGLCKSCHSKKTRQEQ
jgi:5-methylcytosine-specific restriction protein A